MDGATLTRLISLGRGLLAELDLDALLRRVLDHAREITSARYAAVGIVDERGAGLERFLTSGIPGHERETIGDLPSGRGVLGLLIQDPHPLRLTDVGAHPKSYGFPLNHPPMRSFLGVPIVVRGEAWGNLYLTEKEGGDFTHVDEEAMVILADWAAIAVANARLYQGIAARRDELERTVRALQTTTEIASATGGAIELERILELLAKRGRALVAAKSVVIMLTDQDELTVAATAGIVPDALVGKRLRTDGSNFDGVMRSRHAARLTDINRRAGQPFGDLHAHAGLMVPLLHRGRPLGLLCVFDRLEGGPEFSAEDERLLQAFAASAATAVATAQTVVTYSLERSIRASEAERTRWARELHDETLQDLAALQVLLTAARRNRDGGSLDQALGQAIDLVTGSIGNLRALITDLRPAALDEIGPGAALSGLVDRVRAMSGIPVDLVVDLDHEEQHTPSRLTADLEETLYRVVQEALTNAVKHAAAAHLHVEIHDREQTVQITVRDDGRGFDPQTRSAGFGLVGMRERVALVHGTLHLRSSAQEGTVVEVLLPVRRRLDETASPAAGDAHASSL